MALALNAVASGTAMVTENVYESRFSFVNELSRLGAEIRTDGHHAIVRGHAELVWCASHGARHPGRGGPGRSRVCSPRVKP